MASVLPRSEDLLEPSRKRQKLSTPPPPTQVVDDISANSMSEVQAIAHDTMTSQRDREAQAGILCFVNESNPGFSGILKQRYTDFLVNEITLDGKVVHLTDINVPRRNIVNKVSSTTKALPSVLKFMLMAKSFIKFPYGGPSSSTGAESGEKLPASPAPVASVEVAIQTDQPENKSQLIPGVPGSDVQPGGSFKLDEDDTAILDSYFGIDTRRAVLNLYEKLLKKPQAKPGSLGTVSSEPINDRQLRGKMHQDMRRIFNSRLDTVTDADGIVTISVAQKANPQGRYGPGENARDNGRYNQSKGRLGWQELGGEHLHFSLYKENKDTMEVISYISSQLKTSPRQFNFAGTKDRRGVTVQRVSVHRVRAETLVKLNKTLRGSKVGNFQYQRNRLELGDLKGNEFLITLRDCHFVDSDTVDGEKKVAIVSKLVGAAMKNMQVHGFLNYYGLQRFGSYATGTDDVGRMILQGDFEGAVNAILTYGDDALACAQDPNFVPADGKPLSRDDVARAEALHIFKTTGDCDSALSKLSRKFSGETSIIRYVKRNRRDFLGALLQIPRNLRLMYVHAYQSLVWNMAASERWTRYGNKIVKGDLVLVDSKSAKHIEDVKKMEVDESGEIIVLPATDDTAITQDDFFERARPLTAEEAASGNYSIFDIVLPTPGYDIEYPDNDIGDYYKEFMSSDRGGGLDPGSMRRSQHDFSLSGSYRKLLARIGDNVTYEIKLYSDDNKQMVETDLEKMAKSKPGYNLRDGDHGSRGDWKASGDWRSHGNQKIGLASEENMQQQNDWKTFPSKLAKEEKAAAEFYDAQKFAENNFPKTESSQPAYNETFIQTSTEHGKRTGHRETTVTPSITTNTTEVSTNVEKALEETIGEKPNKSIQSGALTVSKLNAEDLNGMTDSALKSSDTGDLVNPEVGIMDAMKGASSQRVSDDAVMKDSTDPVSKDIPMDGAISEGGKEAREKIAVIVKFQLGSSQYATMALRELMKQGGVQTFKPEFSAGR